ncbi:hypothetical protein BOX15_Mlig024829g1 [Macrostomum lignano]|uniref:prostaglandin-endoperoxide synthase n=1 Tax=Macrostomum lignano TaxID=282301 RepID=A0A267G0P7_9PLAT|nr:hypothetical protein BOX15_Mlig024829g1 [Macrostomum lignano]
MKTASAAKWALAVSCLTLLVLFLRSSGYQQPQSQQPHQRGRSPAGESQFNPCCSSPCKNGGICMEKGSAGGFECDCTNTGYYGRICQRSNWSTWLARLLRPDTETTHYLVTNFRPLWSVVNRLTFLRRLFMRLVLKVRLGVVSVPPSFRAGVGYTTVEGFSNMSYYSQTLPPVPLNCPTPMGVVGPKQLPTVGEVVAILFKRQPGQPFKPSAIGTNMLFGSFAQHFSHMFFKSDPRQHPGYTWGDHNIYVSHLYGKNTEVENRLREFRRGRMRSQLLRGEEFPPFLSQHLQLPDPAPNPRNVSRQFAVGHQIANLLPTGALWQTIYLREHNRVAGLLARLHPGWDDERIFQTTKLILIGKTLKIVVEEYVQHLSNYHFKLLFDPTLMHGEAMQYQNRIAAEFNLLYHWHPLMADDYRVAGTTRRLKDEMFNGTKLLDHSSRDYVEGLVNSIGGSFTANNHPEPTLIAARAAVQMGRTLRLQSLNAYRKRFRLKPYKTFQELAGGDEDLACALRSLYKDVDAVEFYPGLVVERHRPHAMFGSSMIEIGSPYSLQGIFGNALASPQLWRPATFGGSEGFRMVTEATLRDLVCNNVPSPCPIVQFSVPTPVQLMEHQQMLRVNLSAAAAAQAAAASESRDNSGVSSSISSSSSSTGSRLHQDRNDEF